jgi:hypothetical protein
MALNEEISTSLYLRVFISREAAALANKWEINKISRNDTLFTILKSLFILFKKVDVVAIGNNYSFVIPPFRTQLILFASS